MRAGAALGGLALVACGKGDTDTQGGPFPADFLWGTATAGFQVEAGCDGCDDPHSDWYQWVTDPDLIAESSNYLSGDPLSMGPGMWQTWEQDAAVMHADGMTTVRLGIEWSRLFPEANSATTVDELAALADPQAVARYHEILTAIRAEALEPMVTVNHYTLPLWIHDGKACHLDPDTCSPAGWVDPAIVPKIAVFAGYLAREFGSDVRLWATLNEPLAVPASGYLQPGEDRTNPPGLSGDALRAKAALQNQILASAAMYDAIHAEDADASVGVVMNMTAVAPYADEDDDRLGAEHFDHVYHALFLEGLTEGAWDADADGTFEATRPELVGRLDWVGVNYYATVTVRGLPIQPFPDIPCFDFYPEIGWYPDPARLDEVLERAGRPGLPLYITENGQPGPDEDLRATLLTQTLDALGTSIQNGRDVRGYYYWSYVDNYEWNHGMGMTFGLYALDTETKVRTERPVMRVYREKVAGSR